ncbi:MAG TPA: DUF3293 domain-containing protein [Luteitalea sp.]|nr:DUF3293 domain-containing protein [Luteitalea sp.]
MVFPSTLLDAYRRTEYRVEWTVEPFVLHVDQPSPTLLRCHAAFGVHDSTFITAWNPHSSPTPADANAAAMARLAHHIATRGLQTLPGVGIDPSGKWAGEESLLVLGLDAPSAVEMARAFGQNAVVCAGPDAVPRLVVLPGS